MACNITISGRGLQCKDALGGIKEVWIGQYSGTGQYAAPAAGAIADAAASGFQVDLFEMQQGSSSFTQTVTASTENGSVYYTQVLSLSFNKMLAIDVAQAFELNRGRLTVIVVDKNDQYWVMGHKNGVEVTGGTFVSGQAVGDLNGMTIELTAMELMAAPALTTTTGGNIGWGEAPTPTEE